MVRSKTEVKKIAKKYGAYLSQIFDDVEIRLFGSYHKGNAKEGSDIDLAVISPDLGNMDYLLSLKILNRLKIPIASDIEPISLTPAEFKKPRLGTIAYAIHKSSELVYKHKTYKLV
jgi:predicted nucleotidyltransferase